MVGDLPPLLIARSFHASPVDVILSARYGQSAIHGRLPSPDLSLDQVLAFIRKLDATARSQVARVLAESDMDARLGALIRRLAQKAPVDEVSDLEIQAEVDAVRLARLRTPC